MGTVSTSPASDPDDKIILEKVREGQAAQDSGNMYEAKQASDAAFDILVTKYWNYVWTNIIRKVPSDRVPDVVQAIWLDVRRQLLDLHAHYEGASLRKWLLTIMRGHIANDYRQSKREQGQQERLRQHVIQQSKQPHGENLPEQELMEKHRLASFSKAWERLSPSDKELLTWRYQDGLSILEITALLNKKDATVRKLLERARNRLRKNFQEEGGE
jgi:RNA polymerase sigma-70 factor (ECF subfamily)